MTEYRIARPQEWEDCIELINYVFSISHRPHDFEKMLPKVYQAGPEMASIHRVAVDERGRLRALIAVLPETVMAAGKKLRAGYVGSVAVHPKARGEGHMKHLMNDWLRELEDDCDLLVLDGQRQRYGYFGFEPGSMRYVFIMDQANVRHGINKADLDRITFGPLFEAACPRERAAFAKRLNEEKPAFVVREPERMEAVLSTFGADVLGAYVDGELSGYLVCSGTGQITEAACVRADRLGRGDASQGTDGTGNVAVCPGMDSSGRGDACPGMVRLTTIVAAYMAWRGMEQVRISVPVYQREQVRDLAAVAEDFHLERCGQGLYRILNYANVLEAYLTLKAKTLGLTPGAFSAVLEGQPVTVTWDGRELEVVRDSGPAPLILDRRQAHELLLSFLTSGGDRAGLSEEEWNDKIPRDWFPLPIYWSVADEF